MVSKLKFSWNYWISIKLWCQPSLTEHLQVKGMCTFFGIFYLTRSHVGLPRMWVYVNQRVNHFLAKELYSWDLLCSKRSMNQAHIPLGNMLCLKVKIKNLDHQLQFSCNIWFDKSKLLFWVMLFINILNDR